jgi:hypothetical protein
LGHGSTLNDGALALKNKVLESISYYCYHLPVEPLLLNPIQTFASTNSYLFAFLCHFGLQRSMNLTLDLYDSGKSLHCKLPTFAFEF